MEANSIPGGPGPGGETREPQPDDMVETDTFDPDEPVPSPTISVGEIAQLQAAESHLESQALFAKVQEYKEKAKVYGAAASLNMFSLTIGVSGAGFAYSQGDKVGAAIVGSTFIPNFLAFSKNGGLFISNSLRARSTEYKLNKLLGGEK